VVPKKRDGLWETLSHLWTVEHCFEQQSTDNHQAIVSRDQYFKQEVPQAGSGTDG